MRERVDRDVGAEAVQPSHHPLQLEPVAIGTGDARSEGDLGFHMLHRGRAVEAGATRHGTHRRLSLLAGADQQDGGYESEAHRADLVSLHPGYHPSPPVRR